MLRRTSLGCGLSVLLFIFAGFADEKPSAPNSSDLVEFPAILQQKITAGVTAVGTKVQAKLTIPTLVHGTVVPRDTILSGEITESVAKSAEAPSKLGIRMDTARWKDGSLPIKVYLTEWYYETKMSLGENADQDYGGIHGSIGITMGGSSLPRSPTGGGTISPENDPPSIPTSPDPAPSPSTTGSDPHTHRARMQHVESHRQEDGSFVIVSKKNGLKLDKNTTYVFASEDLFTHK